jgi:Flp pilus assembly protein TadD
MAKAEEAFREFEKRSPPDGESEFYRGLFLQRSGKPEKAVERLRRSLALDPTRARCHYLLSLCYRDLAMEDEAAAELAQWRKAEEARQKEMHDHEERSRRPAPAPGGDRPAGEAPKEGG